eukprot:CAMPEP_0117608300 /NCGR_PEP_ID=MMETSP0784-20121206/80737_1 /TAXON_ID=39447 /ORGANISM="" /LENGTH=394 /DNA_ID=CAMNT_0005411569 /DNA_START=63 /DNA_END=1247 /DNA_ORIENTATION=+
MSAAEQLQVDASEPARNQIEQGFPLVIEISNLAGPLCNVTACGDWSVNDLKLAVADATGIHPFNQRLLFNGETLGGSLKLLQDFLPAHRADIILVRSEDVFVRLLPPYGCCAEDMLVESMSLSEAKERCVRLSGCQGFTFRGNEPEDSEVQVEVRFKSKDRFKLTDAEEHYRSRGATTWTDQMAAAFRCLNYDSIQTYLYIDGPDSRSLLVDFVSHESHREATKFIHQRELVEDLVGRNFFSFQNGLRADPGIIEAAAMQNPHTLAFAPHDILSNKEFILRAVRRNGLALRYASEEMQADKEVVCAAINENPGAFRFAAEEVAGDREVVLRTLARRGIMLGDVAQSLKVDRSVVLVAVRQNAALQYASEDLQNDPDLQFEADQQRSAAKRAMFR